MTDTVKVDPTPIQRNRFDVAMELTNKYYTAERDPRKLEELFAKFYALACYLENSDVANLQNLLGEELINKIGKIQPINY